MKLKFDSKFISLLLMLILVITIVHPIGLPVQVSKMTRGSYDLIENLPEGSLVVYFNDASVGGWASVQWLSIAVLQHMMQRPIKIVILTCIVGGEMSVFLTEDYLLPKVDIGGKEYGVDYVHLGFIPGAEITVASLAEDVHKLLVTDYRGNMIDDLPIMDEFKNWEDIDLVFTNGGTLLQSYVRQLYVPYNIQIIGGVQGTSIQLYMPYYEGGQIAGMLCDIKAAGEYELLMGKPSGAIKFSDLLSIAYLLMIGIIIVGNVQDLIARKEET